MGEILNPEVLVGVIKNEIGVSGAYFWQSLKLRKINKTDMGVLGRGCHCGCARFPSGTFPSSGMA